MDPTEFLGIPLTRRASDSAWIGDAANGLIHVSLYRELDVQWLGYPTPSPVWWRVYFRFGNSVTEEAQGPDISDLEDYFRTWIKGFKDVAKAVAQLWPDEENV